jgi:hypothetical protein
MGILNNIPRKNGVIPTGANYDAKLDKSRLQHVPNGFEGTSYAAPLTSSAVTNAPQHNTATISQVSDLQVQQPGVVVPANSRIKLHPGNTHILAHDKPHKIVHRAGGPSPTSNTPFHPQPHAPRPRPSLNPAITTDKMTSAFRVATSQPSTQPPQIGTPVSPIGSFLHVSNLTLSSHSNQDINAGRWQTVKHGAAG